MKNIIPLLVYLGSLNDIVMAVDQDVVYSLFSAPQRSLEERSSAFVVSENIFQTTPQNVNILPISGIRVDVAPTRPVTHFTSLITSLISFLMTAVGMWFLGRRYSRSVSYQILPSFLVVDIC